MPHLVKSVASITTLGLLVAAGALWASSTPAATAQDAAAPAATNAPFDLDPVHTSVVFGIKHMNVANFYGTFDKFSGSFNIDAANPANTKINITVEADSVDSNNKGRDDHLKGPDFFSVKEFPTITFVSTKVEKASGENMFNLTGDLTFRGVTKPITATLQYTGTGPGRQPGITLQGFEARFTFKRSDFGNTYLVGKGLSDEVSMLVAVEGIRK
ncbi:MAG: YceI family protein [Phycisphaerales bacterium]|jgi:polyisoprenoid-binding protein YceI|nr:YceI family protein [Phycisphaerales bacterium]